MLNSIWSKAASEAVASAVDMIGHEGNALEWLATPNKALGVEKPVDLLETETGVRIVEDVLGRIAYGVYS